MIYEIYMLDCFEQSRFFIHLLIMVKCLLLNEFSCPGSIMWTIHRLDPKLVSRQTEISDVGINVTLLQKRFSR